MNRTFLVTAVAAGVVAAAPVTAQQDQGSRVPPNREETVPLQLKAEQVRDMQQRLNAQGFSAGRVDGLWGPDTSAAVRNFQERNRLRPTGQLDQGTLRALGMAGTLAVSPATLAQNTTVPPTPGNPPGTALDRAADRSLGTNTTGTNRGANAPSGASGIGVPGATSNAPMPGVNPSTGVTPATGLVDRNTGTAAASGDRNQAIATTGANAAQPAYGANSFTMGEAQRRIASHGFQGVSDLHKDEGGVWRGTATRSGTQVQVWLDYKGNVGQH